jgi:hypothetical protein
MSYYNILTETSCGLESCNEYRVYQTFNSSVEVVSFLDLVQLFLYRGGLKRNEED